MTGGPVLVVSPYRFGRFPGRHHELTSALRNEVPVIHLSVRVCAEARRPQIGCDETNGMILVDCAVDRATGVLLDRAPAPVARRVARRVLLPTLTALPRAVAAWSWLAEPWVDVLVDGPTVVDVIDPPLDGNFTASVRVLRRLARHRIPLSCTADALADDVRAAGGAAEVIRNGWAGVLGPPPAAGRLVCGYLGTVDERFDHELVRGVAAALPDVRFVIGGRVNHDQHARFAPIAALPNVEVTGPIPYGDRPGFDVGLIPFRPGPVGDRINPVKMYEYLAAGAEVVATGIRECRAVPLVRCGDTVEAWVAEIRRIGAGDRRPPQQRAAFLAGATWAVRAAEVLDRLGRLAHATPAAGGPR